MAFKTCNRCKEELPLNCYGVDNRRPFGKKDKCKICETTVYREKRNYDTSLVKSLVGEEWRPVEGHERSYEVSNFGRVKSLQRHVRMGESTGRFTREKVLVGKIAKTGYRIVMLSNEGRYSHLSVHRLVAKAFIPLVDGKDVVNHKDCNPLNNNVSNLEWCTSGENTRHASDNGRMRKGKEHHAATSVAKCDLKGNVIKRYSTMSEAAIENNCCASGISFTCKGGTYTCAGFHWKKI